MDKLFFIETKRVLLTLYILLEFSIIPHTHLYIIHTPLLGGQHPQQPGMFCFLPVELLTSSLYPTSPFRIQKFPQMGQSEPTPMTAPVGHSVHRMGWMTRLFFIHLFTLR
jgi:hypothetical protein